MWWAYLAGPDAGDPPVGVTPVVLPGSGHHEVLLRAVDNPEVETTAGGIVLVV